MPLYLPLRPTLSHIYLDEKTDDTIHGEPSPTSFQSPQYICNVVYLDKLSRRYCHLTHVKTKFQIEQKYMPCAKLPESMTVASLKRGKNTPSASSHLTHPHLVPLQDQNLGFARVMAWHVVGTHPQATALIKLPALLEIPTRRHRWQERRRVNSTLCGV